MMIDQPAETNPVYFTILPSKAGFTDQLYQFSVFYKLGLALGYEYRHSEFVCDREGTQGIYEFLGFNRHFHKQRLTNKDALYRRMVTGNRLKVEYPHRILSIRVFFRKLRYRLIGMLFFREFNFIDIGLDDSPLERDNGDPVEYFRTLVSEMLARHRSSNPRRRNVVRFYLETGRYFFLKLAPCVAQQTPYFPDGLDLRSSYLVGAGHRAIRLPFSGGGIKLEMHVRMGDTALMETPWRTFVPLWSGRPISPLREYPDKNDSIFGHTMDVSDYWAFLQRFLKHFGPDDLSIAVFSDGYKAGFRELFSKVDDLKLDDRKLAALKESASTYDREKFSVFENVPHCVCVVGEIEDGLMQLVDATLVADVIVMGCNQNMISKLLATYGDAAPEKPSIIIMLYRGALPEYRIELGERVVIYPVNVSDLDADTGLVDAVNAIRRRRELLKSM